MRAFILPIFLWITVATGCSSTPVYEYEPAQVNLTGIPQRESFSGPSNHESTERGDPPKVYWILRLKNPISVRAKSSEELYQSVTEVKQVQLVLEAEQYTRYRKFLGRKIRAEGSLFYNHSSHHKTKVLMLVKNLEE